MNKKLAWIIVVLFGIVLLSIITYACVVLPSFAKALFISLGLTALVVLFAYALVEIT